MGKAKRAHRSFGGFAQNVAGSRWRFTWARRVPRLCSPYTCLFFRGALPMVLKTLSRKRKGGVRLKFDLATVQRLVDHARNAPRSLPYYGGTRADPALWLVGDHGVYLMSNGQPPLGADGQLITGDAKGVRRLNALAVGCDPEVDAFESWWPVHNAIAD